MMSVRTILLGMGKKSVCTLLLTCLVLCAQGQQLELYGNFHSLGIDLEVSGSDDPDQDAVANLAMRKPPNPFQPGQPLVRVSATRFSGSAFFLQPDSSYEIEVTLADPDGGPLDGLVISQQASTRPEPALPTFSSSLVVSPAGTGSACTLGSPCSLSTALSLVQPGEELALLDGVYFQGEFTLPRSGSASLPIGLRAYPGASPILDGADPSPHAWTGQGNGVFTTQFSGTAPHLVSADGERLYPYPSLNDLQNLVWGLPGFWVNGSTLHVKLLSGDDPAGHVMVLSRFNFAFTMEREHWLIEGITFRHYGAGSWAKALYLNNASNNVIQNCSFHLNDTGIGIKRASHRNLIQDCHFSDTLFLWPWDAVKAGSELETGGIVVYSPMSGRGNIIRRNSFHDFFDGLQTCPGSDNGTETNEMDVYENEVWRCGDDGLSADGVCANLRIWNNRFHDVLVGISLAPVLEGPVYCLRNLIWKTGAGNSSYTGLPFKFNVSGQPASGLMFLYHNTGNAFYSGQAGFEIKSPGSWQGIISRNNIWVGTDHALRNANISQPVNLDYDLLWRVSGSPLVRWGNANYGDLAAFHAATGQLAHGIQVDPLFVDPASGNHALQSGSPALDLALPLPGINDTFSGSAADLGAFELSSPSSIDWSVWRAAQGDANFSSQWDANGDLLIDVRDFLLFP